MAKDNKVRMPSSMGGLVSYHDAYKSKVHFKPGHIIILILVVIALEILLHIYGGVFFG